MENPKILTKCLVLSKRNFGEGHMDITLITEKYGVVRASAFGGQRLSKRFRGGLDYFKLIEAELEHKKKNEVSVFSVTAVKNVIKELNAIGKNIARFAAASYIQELCAIILTPNETSGKSGNKYFTDLYNALIKLEKQDSNEEILTTVYEFSINIYTETGFLPEIKRTIGIRKMLCHLEEFNSRILGTAPKSFAVLETVVDQ